MSVEMRHHLFLSIILFLLSLSYIQSISYEPEDESEEMIALNDAFYNNPDGYILLKKSTPIGGAVLRDLFGKKKRNVGGIVLKDLLGKKKRVVVGGTVLKDILGK